jgi:threonine/homoserine/homoserine lactone efflux protein
VIGTYVLVTLALVLTPGATTAVVIRQALVAGGRAGILTAAGAAAANSTHAAAAGVGLAWLVVAHPIVAGLLRVGGGGYLLWLAAQSAHRAWRPTALADRVAGAAAARSAFRDGLVVNLLNPAIATFYLVVVPTFVSADMSWSAYVLLAAIHVGLAFLCHVGWSTLFGRVRAVARSASLVRGLDAAAAVALALLVWRTWTS